jgi:DNA-binding IclR family transcriptional regulator
VRSPILERNPMLDVIANPIPERQMVWCLDGAEGELCLRLCSRGLYILAFKSEESALADLREPGWEGSDLANVFPIELSLEALVQSCREQSVQGYVWMPEEVYVEVVAWLIP